MGIMNSGRRVLALHVSLLAAVGTVTMVPASATSPVMPALLVAGEDNGSADDELRFQADEAFAGQTVVLHVIRGTKSQDNKRLVAVLEEIVPDDGELTFMTNDRNRNRKTRFVAKATIDGQTYKSNTQHVR